MINKPFYKNPVEYNGALPPCTMCGRPIKAKYPKMLHLYNGGSLIVTTEEAQEFNRTGEYSGGSGDMGAFPIGPECLKNYPQLKPYAF